MKRIITIALLFIAFKAHSQGSTYTLAHKPINLGWADNSGTVYIRGRLYVRVMDNGLGTDSVLTVLNGAVRKVKISDLVLSQNYYIGTTQNALNRASGSQTLTGVSIDGNSATTTNWGGYPANFTVNPTSIDVLAAFDGPTSTFKSANAGQVATFLNGQNFNIAGNSATTTLAANSTLWNSLSYHGGSLATSVDFAMVYDATNSRQGVASAGQMQTFLGLGTNAYESTAKLQLTGGTLSGTLYSLMTGGSPKVFSFSPVTTTTATYGDFRNGSGSLVLGVESSTGSSLATGGTAYACIIGTDVSKPLQLITNNTVRYTIDASGNNTWTGAGTFGGSVSGTNFSTSGYVLGSSIDLYNASAGTKYIRAVDDGGAVNAIGLTKSGSNVAISLEGALTGTSAKFSSLTPGRVATVGTAGLIQDDADLTFDGSNLGVGGNVTATQFNIGANLGTALSINSGDSYAAMFKSTTNAVNIPVSVWNSSASGNPFMMNFYKDVAGTDIGSVKYDRTGDRLNYIAAGNGFLFTGAATFSSTVTVADATASGHAVNKGQLDAKVQNNLTASTTIAPSATAVNTALDLKANIASPTFTDRTTVQSFATGILTTTTDGYNFTSSGHTVLVNASGGNKTINIPSATINTGRIIIVKKIDSSANTVTLSAFGTELIDGASSKVLSTQYAGYQLQSDGAAWYIIATF